MIKNKKPLENRTIQQIIDSMYLILNTVGLYNLLKTEENRH